MKYERWQDVVIIGAREHGIELCSYIQDLTIQGKMINLVGFIDEVRTPGDWVKMKILGGINDLDRMLRQDSESELHYMTAVGDNRLRADLVRRLEWLEVPNLSAWTLRHPRAIVGQGVEIGRGTCLAPGSVLTANVQIGKHCIVNVNASISYNSQIGDFCNINPGAVIAHNVRIGSGCSIGSGAIINDNISIGDWTVIGAGAMVMEDLPAHFTVAGGSRKRSKTKCVARIIDLADVGG